MLSLTSYSTTAGLISIHFSLHFFPGHGRLILARMVEEGVVNVLPKLAPLLKIKNDRLLLAAVIYDKLNTLNIQTSMAASRSVMAPAVIRVLEESSM